MAKKKGGQRAAAASTAAAGSGATSSAATSDVESVRGAVERMVVSGKYGALAPKRPPGTAGRKVKLRTNFFKLSLGKDRTLFHYEITFKAVKEKKKASLSKKKGTGSKKSHSPPSDEQGAVGGAAAPGDAGDEAKGADGEVEVDDKVELKAVNVVRQIFRQMVDQHSAPGQDFHRKRAVFDGKKNMYSINEPLERANVEELRFQCRVDGEIRTIIAEWRMAHADRDVQQEHVLNLSDFSQQSVQGLEIALAYPIGLQLLQQGVRFFENPVPNDSIGMNLILMQGFRKSIRPCVDGYYVNLDRAAGLFQTGGRLVPIFCNILNFGQSRGAQNLTVAGFRMNEQYRTKLERELKNFKIKSFVKGAPFNRTYKIAGFSTKSVAETTFFWQERNRNVSVQEYYQAQYNQVLQPNLPCVVVGQGDRRNYLPVEICELMANQYYDKKMSDRIQREVTNRTIRPVQERYDAINRSIRNTAAMTGGQMDCTIATAGEIVDGRVLPPPTIQFLGQEVIVKENNGPRRNPCDYSGGRFTNTMPIKTWAIVQVSTRPLNTFVPVLAEFGKLLVAEANKRGWNLAATFGQKLCHYTGYHKLREFMQLAIEKGKVQLIVFALPDDERIYNDVKRIQNEIGLISQCFSFDASNSRDLDPRERFSRASKITNYTYVENMIKKMNAKVGGTNSYVADKSIPEFLKKKKVMIVGMDVNHPGPGSNDIESLVGIVASYTRDCSQYYHQAMAQPQSDGKEKRRVEEIREAVRIILTDFFKRFQKRNKFFPDAIVVLRDGVSEGQFLKVRNIEVTQIHQAMADCGFQAEVVFLTVQKRHSFRMFVESNGKVDNPLPGTVVDTKVVHAERNEYYLNSHHAIKGTSKPCHYTLIHNEPNLTNDMMQAMSYALCYLSARCDKPTSIPTPVNYAHLVAEKASKILSSHRNTPNPAVMDVSAMIRVHETLIDKLIYV